MLVLPPLAYADVTSNLPGTPWSGIGVNVPSHTTIHTKTATWTELIASTPFESEWVTIAIAATSVAAATSDALLDIGIGGSGSEQILIPNLLAGYAPHPGAGNVRLFTAPLYIPKGSRLSGRAQAITSAKNIPTGFWLYGGAKQGSQATYSRVDALGITSSGASRGTSVTAGNSGALGSWTNIGSTTTRPYSALYLLAQGTLATHNSLYYHFEIGFSSTIMAEVMVAANSNEAVSGTLPPTPIFRSVPTGTQLQVRGTCSGTAEVLSVALYGLY